MEEKERDGSNDCLIVDGKVSSKSAGATLVKVNRAAKENSTKSFERSGEKLVCSSPSNVINIQSARKSQAEEAAEPNSIGGDKCIQLKSPLKSILIKPVNLGGEDISNKPINSVVKSKLETPDDVTKKHSPVKALVFNLVRVSKEEVLGKVGSHTVFRPVALKPCDDKNSEKMVVVEKKDVLNISASYSSDEFEGFCDISDQDKIVSRRELLEKLGSHINVWNEQQRNVEVSYGKTNKDQVFEELGKVVEDCEVLNISGSDDDFEGFDGLSNAEKTLRKFECFDSILVQKKITELNSLKDRCSNEGPLGYIRKTEGSNSAELVQERITRLRSTQNSSATDSHTKSSQTEHYFMKDGRYKCKYCEEEKSSVSLIRRHLKICSDVPLTVILSSIQHGLKCPVEKNIQSKEKENEKIDSTISDKETQSKKSISVQKQTDERINPITCDKEIEFPKHLRPTKRKRPKNTKRPNHSNNGQKRSEEKLDASLSPSKALKLNSNLVGGEILKPQKKRARKAKAKDGPVMDEHVVRLLNACVNSFSSKIKPPILSLIKTRANKTDSNCLKTDNNRIKNNDQIPEENNNHLKTITSNISSNVEIHQPEAQSEKDDKSLEDDNNHSKTVISNNLGIIEPENNLLNTVTSDNIANSGKLALVTESVTETNHSEDDRKPPKKKREENNEVKTSDTVANSQRLPLQPVTETNLLENVRKSPKNVEEYNLVNSISPHNIANIRQVTLEPVTQNNFFETVRKSPKKNLDENNQVKIQIFSKAVTSDNIANSAAVTQKNLFEDNRNSLKKKLEENNQVNAVISDNIASNEKVALEPVNQYIFFENVRKSPKKNLDENNQVNAATSENIVNSGKVTLHSVTQANTSDNKKSSKKKFIDNKHVNTVTYDNLPSSIRGPLQPVIQTIHKTDTSNNLVSRIGLQPIMLASDNLTSRIELQPILSTDFKNHCPHCSVIITDFNIYSKHVLDHPLEPLSVVSTQHLLGDKLQKQDSVDSTRYLLEDKLPKQDSVDSDRDEFQDMTQHEKSILKDSYQTSNWKKNILKNYFDSGNDCTVSSSGYCSSSSSSMEIHYDLPQALCNESSQLESCLPNKNYSANIVRVGSILGLDSQDSPSNFDSNNSQANYQPRVHDPNEASAVIDSMENLTTSIDKNLSDEIQNDNCVCSVCYKKFDNLRSLVAHLYNSHLKIKT